MRYFLGFWILIFGLEASQIPSNSIVGPKIIKKIISGKIYSNSVVETIKPSFQSLDFKIAGIHPKKCTKAFRKISRYENFENYLDVVKKSNYNDKTKRVNFILSSILLPFDMRLNFVLPRITGPGRYNFYFDRGFLKGLTGVIQVEKHKKRCLVTSQSKWLGPKSKIPNVVFEFFLNTVGKMTMERLFRISRN